MIRLATSSPDARVRTSHVLRFILGIVASGLLVAGAMTMVLTAAPVLLPGWQVTAVSSGSMLPALRVGDAVALAPWPPGGPMLGPPSVVLVERPDTVPILHRVVGHDATSYQTKGDANAAVDSDRVRPDQVLGVARLVIPRGGWIALWVQQGNVWALVGLAVVALGLGWLARFGWMARYDPWLLSRTGPDAHGSTPSGHDGDPPPGPSDPAGARRSPGPALFLAVTVVVSALLVLSGATASASLFSSTTAVTATTHSARLHAPENLTVRCTTLPQLVSAQTAGPGSPAPRMPADIRSGDNLLLSRTGVQTWNATSGQYVPPSTPPGWTLVGKMVTGGSGRFHAVYRRTAQSGESQSTMPHVTSYADVVLVARGGQVVDSSLNGRVEESGAVITSPSVSGDSGGLLLTFWAVERNNTKFSTPPGMTPVAETSFSGTISMSAHEQQVARAGETGTRTTSLTDATTGAAAGGRHSGLSLFIKSSPHARLTWTASPTTRVTGYRVTRDGTQVDRVDGRDTRSWSDPNPLLSTPSTYAVAATVAGWSSPPAGVSVSATSC